MNIIDMHVKWLYNNLYSGVMRNCITPLAELPPIYLNLEVLRRCIFNCYVYKG
jgi:hypothetical protein